MEYKKINPIYKTFPQPHFFKKIMNTKTFTKIENLFLI